MVLTIHVVRQGGHRYYVDDLVPGRAEGGRVAGEEPGSWSGSGAAVLGLSGPVHSTQFAEVLEGRDPLSGRGLRISRGSRSAAGYDLTFCAPKSVSILHLLAPREIAAAAGTGHRVAVADALAYLAREGVGVRRVRRGATSFLATTGPVAAEFLHRTSRALDPHLHSHVVVANVAQGVDGVWSGVDSRRLHTHLPAAQSVYHARLRFELGDRMGAVWRLGPSGVGEIVGVEDGLRRLFSQRTASMDEYRARRGGGVAPVPGVVGGGVRPHGRASPAFYADRPAKERSVTVDQLTAQWRQRAADLGFDLGDLTRSVGAHRHDDRPVIDRDRLRERMVALTSTHRSVGRHQVVAAVGASTLGGGAGRDLEAIADGLLGTCGPSGPQSTDGGPARRMAEARGIGGGRRPLMDRWDPSDLVRAVDRRRSGQWIPAGERPVGVVSGPGRSRSVMARVARPNPERVDAVAEMTRAAGLER